ncbi:MAG: hypothetical protein LBC73_06845 [Oscillospiraceae bacterium]|jgi:precorrin-2 methylase|nr:hypothetical protein [Oscillospiraceae bacterium]
MIYNIPEPDISPDFTIDDIHKIREYHYEMLKDATSEERKKFYGDASRRVQERIAKYRNERVMIST